MFHDCCSVNLSPAADSGSASTDSCCAPNLSTPINADFSIAATNTDCPTCQKKGKKIDTLTVKSMVTVSLKMVSPTEQYYFCKTPDCPTVYFRADGKQLFTTNQLREAVHQKSPNDESVSVCYCFGHTPAGIRAELEKTGHASAADDIREGINAGQCACEVRNPQGNCCLGNVNKVIAAMREQVASPIG